MFEHGGIKIQWLGHDGFRLAAANNVIYIDPYKLSKSHQNAKDGDLILITHNHFDHMSLEDLEQVVSSKTTIVAAVECVDKLRSVGADEVKGVSPGDSLTTKGFAVEVVAAYNTNKKFHPKADKKVGYIITINNVRIYHTGDTDYIPEMASSRADIALVPVSGTYVMTFEEAARAVSELIKPKLAIPMHYGAIVGSEKDAKSFANLVKVCPVEILKVE